jgi:cysteine synthase
MGEARGAASDSGVLDLIGGTPLVPLRRLCAGLPAMIWAKCEHLAPGGSVKDRIAKAIVADAEARGTLIPGRGMTIVEATAGNTGIGLALVAAARGYRLVCVMPEKMSVDKRVALEILGAEVRMTANAPADSPDYFRNVVDRLAAEEGWFCADQFRNPANPGVHEATTGPEIDAQTRALAGAPVAAFVSGAGTGGTISGVGRHLKRRDPATQVHLADPIGSGLAGWVETGTPGEDGAYAVEGIGGSAPPANLDRSVIDGALQISDEESFAVTRRLIREEGLLVGGSAGTNVAAALRLATSGALRGPIVTVLCDSWDRYLTRPWLRGPTR